MADRLEIEVRLRDRNQLTLPDRIASRIGLKAGDRLLVTLDPGDRKIVQLTRLPDSYAGIAGDLYGGSTEAHLAYVAEERASWEPSYAPPESAPDGTPYLTFEESKRVYRQTEVTRERYGREPKLRWPKCEMCGRSMARMNDHRAAHRAGRLTEQGRRTDAEQKKRSKQRVAKWRRAMAAKTART